MLVVWLISIVVIGIISKFIFNHYHKTERLIRKSNSDRVNLLSMCMCILFLSVAYSICSSHYGCFIINQVVL